jgi:hypothetical protein
MHKLSIHVFNTFTLLGIVISIRPELPNAPLMIASTVSGSVISVNPVQPENAYPPIEVIKSSTINVP